MSSLVNYTYWKWDSILSQAFCNSILQEINWDISEPATISGVQLPADPSKRVTDIIWQNQMHPLGCIARTYIDAANQAAGWDYILSGQEQTQLGRYKSIDKGHYDWHMDSFPPENGIQRKLSCVILLNDPKEFEGGVLQIKNIEDQVLLQGQGSIVVFPSFIEHKVTPVTKGMRYTAVTWAYGPSFK